MASSSPAPALLLLLCVFAAVASAHRPINELCTQLVAIGLPCGLVPDSVKEFHIVDEATGRFEVTLQNRQCFVEHAGRNVRYFSKITGNISPLAINNLIGVEVYVEDYLDWVPVTAIVADDSATTVTFFVGGGASEDLPFAVFRNPPRCKSRPSAAIAAVSAGADVHDVLRGYLLPGGLVPDSVADFRAIGDAGRFEVDMKAECNAYRTGYQVIYRSRITGTISIGAITGLVGVEVVIDNVPVPIVAIYSYAGIVTFKFASGFTQELPFGVFDIVQPCWPIGHAAAAVAPLRLVTDAEV